jgi:hypothetical protein
MRETAVEKRLKTKIERMGGQAWKWVSPGTRGVPDRIIFLPGGRTVFIELKAPGKKPDPIQEYRIRQLRDLGQRVEVLDSLEAVDRFIEEVKQCQY